MKEIKKKVFKIKKLAKNDLPLFKELILLFHEVFDIKNTKGAEESYLNNLLKKPGFIACVVIRENKVIGGLTAYELPLYYGNYSEVYIYDMAVKQEFQRQGIGKKLIAELKQICKKNGIREMFVEAHEEDKHAVDFYKSTGGKAERVVHFNYKLKN
jgi:aminoglycoside 3-N-acetyltransferase I